MADEIEELLANRALILRNGHREDDAQILEKLVVNVDDHMSRFGNQIGAERKRVSEAFAKKYPDHFLREKIIHLISGRR